NPTIASLAGRLRACSPEPTRPIVECLQSGAGGPVLVLLPSLFGHYGDGARLTPLLPPNLRIHALKLAGDQPYWEGCQTLTDMAGGFVRPLFEAVPTGPYVLAGFSFGGRLAFEMAQQMQAVGRTPQRVIIVDTPIENGPRPRWTRFSRDIPSVIANIPGKI